MNYVLKTEGQCYCEADLFILRFKIMILTALHDKSGSQPLCVSLLYSWYLWSYSNFNKTLSLIPEFSLEWYVFIISLHNFSLIFSGLWEAAGFEIQSVLSNAEEFLFLHQGTLWWGVSLPGMETAPSHPDNGLFSLLLSGRRYRIHQPALRGLVRDSTLRPLGS